MTGGHVYSRRALPAPTLSQLSISVHTQSGCGDWRRRDESRNSLLFAFLLLQLLSAGYILGLVVAGLVLINRAQHQDDRGADEGDHHHDDHPFPVAAVPGAQRMWHPSASPPSPASRPAGSATPQFRD